MLSAGFKFICCSTEDEGDNPKITWHENLLVLENLQVRQQEINNQVTMTFLAANNEGVIEHNHRHTRSQELFKTKTNNKPQSLINSLASLSRASGYKLTDFF